MGGGAQARGYAGAGDERRLRQVCLQRRRFYQRQARRGSVVDVGGGADLGLVHESGRWIAGAGCRNFFGSGPRRGGETWGVRNTLLSLKYFLFDLRRGEDVRISSVLEAFLDGWPNLENRAHVVVENTLLLQY
jgi:hypothetical protein